MSLFSLSVTMGILEKLPVDNVGTHLKNKNSRILSTFQHSKLPIIVWNSTEEYLEMIMSQGDKMSPLSHGNFLNIILVRDFFSFFFPPYSAI